MEQQHQRQPNDTVTVHHDVLRTIVRAAALEVDGVARLGNASATIDRWLGLSSADEGIRLTIEENEITVTLALIVHADYNLHDIGRAVQREVQRTLKEYVGMTVIAVNIHIEDVLFGAK